LAADPVLSRRVQADGVKKFSAGLSVLLDQIVDPLEMWDDALQGAITGISV
jgi:hypothetical protein